MNNKIKCIVIDDEPLAVRLIEKYIGMVPELECIGSSQSPMEAISLLREREVDLIFLDIQMPVINGIEFLKSMDKKPHVIFTTAYREYAVESYELDVVDYVLKPISFSRFLKAANKFMRLIKPENTNSTNEEYKVDYLFVNVNRKMVKVFFSDILFIESIKDYIRIYTKNSKVITKEKISDFIDQLPDNFIRIHRSYIVNKDKITAFTSNDVEVGSTEIPIGISYKNSITKKLK